MAGIDCNVVIGLIIDIIKSGQILKKETLVDYEINQMDGIDWKVVVGLIDIINLIANLVTQLL